MSWLENQEEAEARCSKIQTTKNIWPLLKTLAGQSSLLMFLEGQTLYEELSFSFPIQAFHLSPAKNQFQAQDIVTDF